jgi:hypothetical protein
MLSYTVEVRAKDDFIGGNNVYTNDIQSNITADGKTYTLPHPMVNVKAEISVNDAEKTIFLGSTVPADADVLSGFFSETGNYTYQWYTDAECKNEISWEELGQATPGIDGATYYVKVSYVSVQPDPEALENTDNNYVGKGTLGYSAYDIGTYTIHVVDGTITVQKTISKTDYNAKQGDPIFTFKISNGTTSYYRTIRFTETDVKNASSDTVTLSATLTGIAKGNYTVEELESSNYTLKSVAVDAETSFDSSKNGNQVTFMVGDITKRYGKVTFTNTKGDSSLPRDTDTVNNTLKLGQKIVQTKDGDNGR